MDSLHRFHVDFDAGGEAEYLVNGEGTTDAANRLQAVLSTNDKVHEAYPAPDPILGHGVLVIADLPCPMSMPDSPGLWVWWVDRKNPPVIVEVSMGEDGLGIRHSHTRDKPRTLDDWRNQHGTNRPFVKIHRPS